MPSKESRAYCSRGQMWLTTEESNANLLQQCRDCDHMRFIGCPGFHHKMEVCDPDTRDWIQWWYWNKPISKEDLVQSSTPTVSGVDK